MNLLRVDMHSLRTWLEPVPPAYEHWGGRGLIAKLLLAEIPATCEALGPNNKLIFAPGLLGGAGVTTGGRLSIGAKSPLTKGIKEANAGGSAGDTLARLGLKGIVVENHRQSNDLYLLRVSKDSTELVTCDDLRGVGTYATSESLQNRYGPDTTVISIGQAGEYMLAGAAIACTGDKDQRSNIAARGGLGAVMGSKGLKAIVIDDAPTGSFPYADVRQFRAASKRFSREIIENPKLGPSGGTHTYGTAAITAAVNEMGSLPTKNFSSGSFESSPSLRGEHLRETILAREGQIGKRCMTGCVIACRNVYVNEAGEPIVGTLQYETIALVGSNLGLGDLDEVAQLNYICNDFGLDTIEIGAALGIALEAGLAQFGDFKSIVALLKQVGEGTVLGKVIGCGAVITGQVLGIQRVPAVMGQAMPGYDPRSLKGNGVTYATSPQGADHTAGNAFGARNQVNPLGIEGQKELSLQLQLVAVMLDSTGLCLFARPPVIADPQLMVDMLNSVHGWNWTPEDLDQANREVLRTELEFNRRAGITPADHRIPEYMQREPLAPHNTTFDVPDSLLDSLFEAL